MYRYYGDTKSAEEYFDNMIHWMQFLQTGMEKELLRVKVQIRTVLENGRHLEKF